MFILYCTSIFMFCCSCLWSHTVALVINYHGSRPAYRLCWMCFCCGGSPPSEQYFSQVLRDKALLCSPSGDGTISSLRASVPLFFLCSCSCSLGLAHLRNSVDHTLGIWFSLLFAGKYVYVLLLAIWLESQFSTSMGTP